VEFLMSKSKIDEIIEICQSFFDGNQSLDESIIYEIHQLALEIKSER
jgi:hypothetical protein